MEGGKKKTKISRLWKIWGVTSVDVIYLSFTFCCSTFTETFIFILYLNNSLNIGSRESSGRPLWLMNTAHRHLVVRRGVSSDAGRTYELVFSVFTVQLPGQRHGRQEVTQQSGLVTVNSLMPVLVCLDSQMWRTTAVVPSVRGLIGTIVTFIHSFT